MLGCSEGTLNNLRRTGILPYSSIAGTIYYRERDIEKILEENMSAQDL